MNPLKDPGSWVRRLVVAAAVFVLFGEVSLLTMPYPGDCKGVKADHVGGELQRLATASLRYRARTGDWPKEGVALVPDGPSACLPFSDREPPLDAWGRPYQFAARAGRLEIRSGGDDLTLGTPDDIALLVTAGPGAPRAPAGGP